MTNKKTLDTHYTAKVNEFSDNQDQLSVLRDVFKSANQSNPDYEVIRQKITDLESKCEEELDFYINTAPILFNYYNIVENNNADDTPMNNLKNTNKGILKFFLRQDREEQPVMHSDVQDNNCVQDRATLLEKYIEYTSSNYTKLLEQKEENVCTHCGSSNRIVMMNDGIICCNDCQNIEYIIVDHDKPSYKEQPREVTYFSYRRLNHPGEVTYFTYLKEVVKSILTMLVS
jgi:hypothetical protein